MSGMSMLIHGWGWREGQMGGAGVGVWREGQEGVVGERP